MTTATSLLLIALLGSSCSSLPKQSDPAKSPLSSEKSTLHKRTPNFVDLEVPVDQVWFGCEGKDVKEDVAFLGFYVFDGENLWDFFYRRVLSVTQCTEEEREIREMLKDAKTVRMVGLHPREDKGPNLKDAQIPERLKSRKKMLNSVFIRLQAQGKCKAFFEEDCDLPGNYWGGTKSQ